MDIHKQFIVYHLIDNRTNSPTYNLPIYVGQTSLPLTKRLHRHLIVKGSQFFHWNINDLIIQPIVTIPANTTLDNKQLALDLEAKYINTYLNQGITLYNKQINAYIPIGLNIKIKCITTNQIDMLDNLCMQYDINPRTLLKQINNNLNCGIDKNDNPLFWQAFSNINCNKQKYYHIYIIYDNNIPIYIGKTNNIISRKHRHYNTYEYSNPLLHYILITHTNTELKTIKTYASNAEATKIEQQLIAEYSRKYILFNTIHNTRYNRSIQYFCKHELNIDINNYNLKQLRTLELHPMIYDVLANYINIYQKLKNLQIYIKNDKNIYSYHNRYNDNTKYNIIIIKHNDTPCFITYIQHNKFISLKRIYSTAPLLKQYILKHNVDEFDIKTIQTCTSEEQAKDIKTKLILQLSKQYKLYNKSIQCNITDTLPTNIITIYNENLSYNWFITDKFVYCIPTNTIFASLNDAAKYCNTTKHCISNSCHSSAYAGILQDGTRLKWTIL